MAESWFVSGSPLNQLGQTIGRSPNGQVLPSVATGIQQQSNAATAQALEAYYAEERRRWDANYSQKQTQLDRDYQLAQRTAKNADEKLALDKWYQEQSIGLAKERLAQDQRQFEATTGLDMLKTASSLRGPENYYQAAEYARGVSQMPQSATFLNSLANQTRMADYGAQGGLPNPETMGTLSAKLTGQGGTSAYDDNNLGVIGNIAAKGAHQLAPGSLESLTSTERGLFTSGLDKLGIDTPTFLQQYARSRIGQGTAGTKAA